MESPNSPNDKIARLRLSFVSQLPSRVAEVRSLVDMLRAATGDRAKAETLHRKLHTLKGNSASFGFRELANLAGEGEDQVKALLDSGAELTAASWPHLIDGVRAMETLLGTQDYSATAAPVISPVSKKGKSLKVLVVDDEDMMRLLMSALLQSLGHTVSGEATNGAEAIDRCEKLAPDLILMDVNMPGTSGLKALATIRQTNTVVAVIMASATSDGEAEEAMRFEKCRFIDKPIDIEELRQAINALL